MDRLDQCIDVAFDFVGRETPDVFEASTDVIEFTGFGRRPECYAVEFINRARKSRHLPSYPLLIPLPVAQIVYILVSNSQLPELSSASRDERSGPVRTHLSNRPRLSASHPPSWRTQKWRGRLGRP